MALSTRNTAERRAARVRLRLKKVSNGRPRLSVFRSAKNIYAQVIDDARGVTLAHASTLEEKSQKGADKRALDKGVTEVVFDRGGYIFHGRIKALAEAAREAGLNF
jgi:large subunit ribosomal protein L18